MRVVTGVSARDYWKFPYRVGLTLIVLLSYPVMTLDGVPPSGWFPGLNAAWESSAASCNRRIASTGKPT